MMAPRLPITIASQRVGQARPGWLDGSPSLTATAPRQGFHDRSTETIGPPNGKNVMRGLPLLALQRLRDPDRLHRFGAVADDFAKACTA